MNILHIIALFKAAAAEASDPMPDARAYDDPIVFAAAYDDWRRRRGILPDKPGVAGAELLIQQRNAEHMRRIFDVEDSPHQAHTFYSKNAGMDEFGDPIDGPSTGAQC